MKSPFSFLSILLLFISSIGQVTAADVKYAYAVDLSPHQGHTILPAAKNCDFKACFAGVSPFRGERRISGDEGIPYKPVAMIATRINGKTYLYTLEATPGVISYQKAKNAGKRWAPTFRYVRMMHMELYNSLKSALLAADESLFVIPEIWVPKQKQDDEDLRHEEEPPPDVPARE